TASFWGNGSHRWSGFLLQRHPTNPDLVVAATIEGGVWRSADNGITWQQGGATGLFPTDIHFDRANPNRLWLCAATEKGWVNNKEHTWQGGFFRSDDGGTTWQKVGEEGPYEVLQDPVDAGRLYGTWKETEIRLSRDGGNTWQSFSDGLATKPQDPGDSASDYRYSALAAGPNFVLTASGRGTFYRLNAGETHWQKIERQGVEEIYEGEEWFRHKTGGMGWALGSITVDPRNPNHWFFTDWFAIYQTFDAGQHWQLLINGIEVTVLHCLTQDPSDPAVVHLGMADNGYFHSENGGERFYLADGISNNVKSISLSPKLPNRLYATGPRTWEWEANQVFVSIDRGQHWVRSPMEGLPDMTKRQCNTIIVDPQSPYAVYLGVSGNVAAGAGGIYKSVDGGKKWSWSGAGLPTGDHFYRESIWDEGPEIAVSSSGAILTISRDRSELYRLDTPTATWNKVDPGGRGVFYSVVADPLTPDRFFLSLRGTGLFRSDSGGRTWKKVYAQSTSHVACDAAVKGRVAVGTEDGVIMSTDGGNTWVEMDKRLPYRVGNIVAFAGNRLMAGTGGNGAFWMPLNAVGAQSIQARPATVATVPTGPTNGAMPQLVNPDMSAGTARPTGWGNPWIGNGQLKVMRDTEIYKDAPASLSLATQNGPAYGTVSQNFAPVKAPFQISGFTKGTGKLAESQVAIQVFDAAGKQVGWITLANVTATPRDATSWQPFSQRVELPAEAASCNLVLTLKGEGQVWLDEIILSEPMRYFLD
ncbi:MAG: hypothetical protein JOZ57_09165, partial [Abitibacteriaceae bacterium]|nr:hypothetical protein [Abditibacteriaceae bacterium]